MYALARAHPLRRGEVGVHERHRGDERQVAHAGRQLVEAHEKVEVGVDADDLGGLTGV
jgi:hypothetical protein